MPGINEYSRTLALLVLEHDPIAARLHLRVLAASALPVAAAAVLQRLGRAAEFDRHAGLVFGKPHRGKLRVVEPVQHHQVAAGIDDGGIATPQSFAVASASAAAMAIFCGRGDAKSACP